MEFLKANGVDYQPSQQQATVDYQDVVNQQEIFGDELSLFANKDLQKEVSRWLWLVHCGAPHMHWSVCVCAFFDQQTASIGDDNYYSTVELTYVLMC